MRRNKWLNTERRRWLIRTPEEGKEVRRQINLGTTDETMEQLAAEVDAFVNGYGLPVNGHSAPTPNLDIAIRT